MLVYYCYWLSYFYQISYKTIVCKQQKVSEDIYLSISLLLFYRSDLRTISSTIAQSMLDDLSIQQQQQQTNQGASLSRIDDNFTSTSSSLASATANASGTRVIKKLRWKDFCTFLLPIYLFTSVWRFKMNFFTNTKKNWILLIHFLAYH